MAGSGYATSGWGEVQAARGDQINTLNDATDLISTNSSVTLGQTLASTAIINKVATGVSPGGMITAALVQDNPSTFNGAMPACGVVGGGVPTWNQALVAQETFQKFFDSSGPVASTGIPLANAVTNFRTADGLLGNAYAGAASSPTVAARLALVAALGNVPTWFSPTGVAPGPLPVQSAATQPDISTSSGLQSALLGQMDWLFYVDFPYAFGPGRADLELQAGGNPSWTNGVNYSEVLSHSADFAEVKALYAAAGISLSSDLSSLQGATPITASASAVHYLQHYFTYDGHISIPVLTMHTTNDGLVSPQQETLYANAVGASGNSALLRQVYVDQPGHCAFTASEYIAGLGALFSRIKTGSWSAAVPAALNAAAASNATLTDASYNATADTAGNAYASPPSFDTSGYAPGPFLFPVANGYQLVASDGGVFNYNSEFFGSLGNLVLNAPVVGGARTSDGKGYWLVANDGGVFSFGDATFYGSLGNKTLNAPIVGMAATPDDQGYWLVASDGGVFSFGDANFKGSEGSVKHNAPVVGMSYYAPTDGYTLFASDGGVFNFGSSFDGSAGSLSLNKPVVAGL